MFIPENWGTYRRCRVSASLEVSHDKFTNLNAPRDTPENRVHAWSNIIIHLSGDVIYRTAYNDYHPEALDIFSADTGEGFSVDWYRKSPQERIVIAFDNYLFDSVFLYEDNARAAMLEFLDHKKYPNLLRLPDPLKDELVGIINTLTPLLGVNSVNFIIPTFACVTQLFALLYKAISIDMQPDDKRSVSALTMQALHYTNEHFRDLSSLKEIATILHVSPEYLSRRFKQDMDVSFNTYLLDKKLKHSRHLLKLGSNVTEAAMESGFSNTSYFIQLYKKKYGTTPNKT